MLGPGYASTAPRPLHPGFNAAGEVLNCQCYDVAVSVAIDIMADKLVSYVAPEAMPVNAEGGRMRYLPLTLAEDYIARLAAANQTARVGGGGEGGGEGSGEGGGESGVEAGGGGGGRVVNRDGGWGEGDGPVAAAGAGLNVDRNVGRGGGEVGGADAAGSASEMRDTAEEGDGKGSVALRTMDTGESEGNDQVEGEGHGAEAGSAWSTATVTMDAAVGGASSSTTAAPPTSPHTSPTPRPAPAVRFQAPRSRLPYVIASADDPPAALCRLDTVTPCTLHRA